MAWITKLQTDRGSPISLFNKTVHVFYLEVILRLQKKFRAHKEGTLNPKIVRNNIIIARNNLGLSQAQFAVLLGVSKRTLEQWEQERRGN